MKSRQASRQTRFRSTAGTRCAICTGVRSWHWVVATYLGFLAACAPHDSERSEPRDGTRSEDPWTDSAAFVIRDDETEEAALGDLVVYPMQGDTIVVADRTSRSIRLFDSAGQYLETLARSGSGPGELPERFDLAIYGDTILAIGQPPFAVPSVARFTATRGFASQRLLRTRAGGLAEPVGQLRDHEYVVRVGSALRILTRLPRAAEVRCDTGRFAILRDIDAEGVGTMEPIVASTVNCSVGHAWPGTRVGVAESRHPMRGGQQLLIAHGRMWAIDLGSGELQVSEDGRTWRQFGTQLSTGSWRAADVAEWKRRHLARALRPIDSARIDAIARSTIVAKMPRVSRALLGAKRGIWLQLFDLADARVGRYVYVDSAGAQYDTVELPHWLDVHVMTDRLAIGVREGEDGVQDLVGWPLPSVEKASALPRCGASRPTGCL